jgi:hypothetical protein
MMTATTLASAQDNPELLEPMKPMKGNGRPEAVSTVAGSGAKPDSQ